VQEFSQTLFLIMRIGALQIQTVVNIIHISGIMERGNFNPWFDQPMLGSALRLDGTLRYYKGCCP
jgi:hypothetical protein